MNLSPQQKEKLDQIAKFLDIVDAERNHLSNRPYEIHEQWEIAKDWWDDTVLIDVKARSKNSVTVSIGTKQFSGLKSVEASLSAVSVSQTEEDENLVTRLDIDVSDSGTVARKQTVSQTVEVFGPCKPSQAEEENLEQNEATFIRSAPDDPLPTP